MEPADRHRKPNWAALPATYQAYLNLYRIGFFPMAESPLHEFEWFSVSRRCMIPLDERIHVPRRLRKTLRSGKFEMRFDTAFGETIRACAQRPKTWLNAEYIAFYEAIAEQGIGHSVEAWCDGRLVGGLYGLVIGGAFCGESMFSRENDASKACLIALVAHLRERGFGMLDSQIINPHTKQFGGYELPNGRFLEHLDAAARMDVSFDPLPGPMSSADALARLLAAPPRHLPTPLVDDDDDDVDPTGAGSPSPHEAG